MQEKIIAHRGASAYAPENTLAAFERAQFLGARWVEFDVMLSADNELFVFHDEILNRTTNGEGEFRLKNSDKLRDLDAGTWFGRRFANEKIPEFGKVLKWLNDHDISANIEIKPHAHGAEAVTTAVLSALNSHWPQNKPMPLISSFNDKVLHLCHGIAPEVPLGLLMHTWQDSWQQKAKELQCYSIHVYHRSLTLERIKQIKNQGYQLFAYTVNNKRQAKKLLAQGVDAIFSDYPDLLS